MTSRKMTLDITQVYGRIEAMAGEMRSQLVGYGQQLAKSVDVLKSVASAQETPQYKIEKSYTAWLLAGLEIMTR